MPRKKRIVPGYGEGHPDDRPGPTYETVRDALKVCLEEAHEAGVSCIVGAGVAWGPDAIGCKRQAQWFINSTGDYMFLSGLAKQIQRDIDNSVDDAFEDVIEVGEADEEEEE